MTAPTRSFTEIAQRGQESVAAAVRIWADLAQASVRVLTTGRSELLDGRRVADFVFGFANQVLEGQRVLFSAVTTGTSTNGKPAFTEIPKAIAASTTAVAEPVAEAVAKTTKEVAETTETAAETVAETTKPVAEAVAETTETAAEALAETTETAAEAVAEVAEGPYGKGSHAPLADRSESPSGFEIKGNDGSKLYHVPGSPFYKRTVAEVWFATPEAAEAAGFLRPASQR